MKLVLATQNPGKILELQLMLKDEFDVQGLPDEWSRVDIPESGDTLVANALQKARFVHEHMPGAIVVADDTGLEVDTLNGAPGVHTARYAGEARDASANMDKLLSAMQGAHDRSARFRTVIACVSDVGSFTVDGVANGTIAIEKAGVSGFGYDPVFVPSGADKTFAEFTIEEKNEVSHRGKAVRALVRKLKEAYR